MRSAINIQQNRTSVLYINIIRQVYQGLEISLDRRRPSKLQPARKDVPIKMNRGGRRSGGAAATAAAALLAVLLVAASVHAAAAAPRRLLEAGHGAPEKPSAAAAQTQPPPMVSISKAIMPGPSCETYSPNNPCPPSHPGHHG
ncbi:hypothetical protein ACP70R_006803 [Stipagrostis hirtigluma subsp. patula]